MAIRMKTVVTMKASAECRSHSHTELEIRDVALDIDEPVERGGTNLGPTPTETAIAALVGCTNVIGHKCADKLGVDLGNLTIDAACQFDRRGVTLTEEIETPFTEIVLTVTSDGSATVDQLRTVGIETDKFCPLSKLFKAAGTKLETHWQNA